MEQPFESKERICRLCLGTLGYFVNIFDNRLEMDNLAAKIMRCAAIEVKKFDGLPDSVCHRCVAKVESSYEFRLLCETSDAKLKRLLLPKILDVEKFDDVEREEKDILNCEISEQTPNETSSEEITILFVSSKRTSAPTVNRTKLSETTTSLFESKRRKSVYSISKSHCSPEPAQNHQIVQESPTEDIPVLQGCSTSNQQVCTDVQHSDQWLENVNEDCEQEHSYADHDSASVLKNNSNLWCVSKKLSGECYSCSSSLENVHITNLIERHEEETRTNVIANEYSAWPKESLPSLSDVTVEVPFEHSSADPMVSMDVMLTSERVPSLHLHDGGSGKIAVEDACEKKYETIGQLSPSKHLSHTGTKNKTSDGSSVNPKSLLLSSNSCSEQEEVKLHDLSGNHSELDSSTEPSLQILDSVNDIGFPQLQSNAKLASKLGRQTRHTSTENAAAALIMLSNSVDNSTSLPDNNQEPGTPSAVNLTNKENLAEFFERTTEESTDDLSDTCLTTKLSLIQIEKNLLHSTENDIENNIVNKRAEKALSNESINVKIKSISETYSVEKVSDYQFNMSTCITANPTDTTSDDAHACIVCEETRVTSSIKKDNLYMRNDVPTTYNQVSKLASARKCNTTQPLLQNDIQENTNYIDMNRQPECLTDSVIKFHSSDIQVNTLGQLQQDTLSCECNIDNSKLVDISNLVEALRKKLPHKQKEMCVQQKIRPDFKEAEGLEDEVTTTELHTDAFQLINNGLGRSDLSEKRENIGNVTHNSEGELYFSNKPHTTLKPASQRKLRKCSYRKRCYSNRKKKSHVAIKSAFENCNSSVSLVYNLQSSENSKVNNGKSSSQKVNTKQLSNKGEGDAVSCGATRTVAVCSDQENELISHLRKPESNESKHAGYNYGLSANSKMNQDEIGHTFMSTTTVNSKTSKIGCKLQLPLKELRVRLVRLEIDANGQHLNCDKRVNIDSAKSSEFRLQRQTSIPNIHPQNTLSNSCSPEGTTRNRTLRLGSPQKSSMLEEVGTALAKVSYRRHGRAKHKIISRTAKKQLKKSKILAASPVLNSSIPNSPDLNICGKLQKYKIPKYAQKTISRLIEERGGSNGSVDDSKSENARWKHPRASSENTPNALAETLKTQGTMSKWHYASMGNNIAVYRPKVMLSSDKMEETESSDNHYSRHTKGDPVTSSLSLDAPEATTNSRVQDAAPCNLPIVNKQTREEIGDTDFKICEEPKILSYNSEPFEQLAINNNKKVSVTRKYCCSKDNMQMNKSDEASWEVKNNIENITSRPIGGKKVRTSRTLTIESYRKLRHSEVRRCSKLNASNKNKHDMNIVGAYNSCFNAKPFHSGDSTTTFGHTSTEENFSKHENLYIHQRDLGINKTSSSLNDPSNARDNKSRIKQHNCAKEPCSAPRNCLAKKYVISKNEALSFDAKYKTSNVWRSVFHIEKQHLRQQILESSTHTPLEHGHLFEKCGNVIGDMKTIHHHDSDDDEQCKIIRKEILKSAYMTPQLAVLTSDSPKQATTFWFEDKPPEAESVLGTDIDVCCSSLYGDLRSCECIENIAPPDLLHETVQQVQNPQIKFYDKQIQNKNRLEMESEIPRLDIQEGVQSPDGKPEANQPDTTKQMDIRSHEVKNNNNIKLKGQNSREICGRSNRKRLPLSCTVEEQLNKTKNDIFLRKYSKNINCKGGTISLSPKSRVNEIKSVNIMVQQKPAKNSSLGKYLSTVFPREVHYGDNTVKSTRNEEINAKSELANSDTIYTSRIQAHSILDNQKGSKCCSSWEGDRDPTFGSSITLQSIIGNATSLDNSSEHNPRPGLKRKSEPNEQNNNSNAKTGEQANSPKGMSPPGALEHGNRDDLLNEDPVSNEATRNFQECTTHQNIDTSSLQQKAEISNIASLTLAEGKTPDVSPRTLDASVHEGDAECSVGKDTLGQNHNSVYLDLNTEPPTIVDSDFITTATVANHELSNSNSKSCSEGCSQVAPKRKNMIMCTTSLSNNGTPFDPPFGSQIECRPNVSSNGYRNNEDQAPKRVCYTPNFIRKDLSNGNVLPKSESKWFVQSKSPFFLRKTARVDRRSKSQESCSNNKPGGKLRMNFLCRRAKAMGPDFRDCSALREIAHHQGENGKNLLYKEIPTAEPVATSVPKATKHPLADQNASKYNTERKHPNIDSTEIFDALNLIRCKHNASVEVLNEEVQTRATENALKVSLSVLNADTQCPDAKSSDDITSKRDKLGLWAEKNPLFASKGKSEKQMFSELLPEISNKTNVEQLILTQKAGTAIENTICSNRTLHNKKIQERNAHFYDICSDGIASQHSYIEHERIHGPFRKRPHVNNIYRSNGGFRDQLRARGAHRPFNKRTNKPLPQRWKVDTDNNGRYRWKGNVGQSFRRKSGFRNNGNGALLRMNQRLPGWKYRRCKTCGKWFTNDFQLSLHFKKGCWSPQIIPKLPKHLSIRTSSI